MGYNGPLSGLAGRHGGLRENLKMAMEKSSYQYIRSLFPGFTRRSCSGQRRPSARKKRRVTAGNDHNATVGDRSVDVAKFRTISFNAPRSSNRLAEHLKQVWSLVIPSPRRRPQSPLHLLPAMSNNSGTIFTTNITNRIHLAAILPRSSTLT